MFGSSFACDKEFVSVRFTEWEYDYLSSFLRIPRTVGLTLFLMGSEPRTEALTAFAVSSGIIAVREAKEQSFSPEAIRKTASPS